MTARVLLVLALVCGLRAAHAIDMRTVPPMHSEKVAADVKLKGRELEAMEVALRQFRVAQFSTSGDLKHFTVELRREPGKLFVSFYPEYHEPSQQALPARNKYGTYITYAVSLRTLKIIGYTFERD
jgi:hypothetical protein